MIEQEIAQIVRTPGGRGERLNEIADQFRRGRNVDDLVTLLDSADTELVSIGAWILGELDFERYNFDQFTYRLRKLTDHEDAAVRFHAFGALYPALDAKDDTTRSLVMKLRHDPNEGVRRSAEAVAARLALK